MRRDRSAGRLTGNRKRHTSEGINAYRKNGQVMAMDKIRLKGMRFFGYHGVYPEENKLGQQYIVDLTMVLDLSAAGRTDDLEQTVSYPDVMKRVRDIVEGPPFQLIEALAEHIASAVLDTYTKVSEITVRVTKPNPPVDVLFDGVSVEICRRREQ